MSLDKFMMPQAQLAKRRLSIGGSDANTIMSGDVDRLQKLWEEKLGRGKPEPPSINMLMGTATEELNAAWYEHVTSDAVIDRQLSPSTTIRVGDIEYIAHATLDGTCGNSTKVWEAKHTSGYDFQTREKRSAETLASYYMPQLQHNMMVTGLGRAVLSLFFDNNRHEFVEVEADPFYQDMLADREAIFWQSVVNKSPPKGMAAINAKADIVAERVVDMTGNNQWAEFADKWIANKQAASDFDSAVSGIKSLLDSDVAKATGHGLLVKRDKRGSVKISAA